MKRFLYAMMAASLVIAGCGTKKEPKAVITKTQKTTISSANDVTEDDVIAALRMIEEAEEAEELSEAIEEAEEEIEEAEAEEEAKEEAIEEAVEALENEENLEDLDAIFEGMTEEEIEEAQKKALEELAELIQNEQEKNRKMADAEEDMGPDALGDMPSDEEAEQLKQWQAEAAEWAAKELQLASAESREAGLQPIFFAENSIDILPESRSALKQNIKIAMAKIEDGHDIVIPVQAEDDAENATTLSQERAESLKKILEDEGLDAEHLHVAAYGSALNGFMGCERGNCADFILV